MIIAVIFIGIAIVSASVIISNAFGEMADAIRAVARQIHVHAETMNKIKHQGIGIDKKDI